MNAKMIKITKKKSTVKKITIKKTIAPIGSKSKFTVAAIGSSLGGLDAAIELFRNLSPKTGMAYIYVQHLSASHKSFLTSILSKETKMKVQEIENMEQMAPDNVYIIPNNQRTYQVDSPIQSWSCHFH